MVEAKALERPDEEQARAMLVSWRFAGEPALLRAALALAAAVPAPLAWTLTELSRWGAELRDWERRWAPAPRPDAQLDALASAAWANLFGGAPFGASPYLQRHLMPAAARVFRSVMRAKNLPGHEQRRVQRDLSEGFLSLLLAERDGVPVWLDLGIRVFERAPEGPIAALATRVVPQAWSVAARCLVGWRSWSGALRAVWPDHAAAALRALPLALCFASAPDGFEAVLDLQLLARLCQRWTKGGAGPTHHPVDAALLRRNLAAVRARLRAMLAEDPGRLLEPLLARPGLHEATVAATRRMAWGWARRELETGFSMGFARASIARCPSEAAPPLDPAVGAALSTWVLLVVLRGRLGHLRRWLHLGTTSDHDAPWGRLLSVALPVSLRGPGGGRAGLEGMRAWLAPALTEILGALRPALEDLAGFAVDRGLRARVEARLRPGWDPSVPFPARDFPSLVSHAAATLRALEEAP